MTLYTEQGKSEYVSSITNNNGLDTIVYALQTDEAQFNPSSSVVESSALVNYKVSHARRDHP